MDPSARWNSNHRLLWQRAPGGVPWQAQAGRYARVCSECQGRGAGAGREEQRKNGLQEHVRNFRHGRTHGRKL